MVLTWSTDVSTAESEPTPLQTVLNLDARSVWYGFMALSPPSSGLKVKESAFQHMVLAHPVR